MHEKTNQPALIEGVTFYPSESFNGEQTFSGDIERFNEMYRLQTMTGRLPQEQVARLKIFKKLIIEELNELEDIIDKLEHNLYPTELDSRVDIADLCGDLIVFSASEMQRFLLPPEDVLAVIMASNFSKLGEDGKPIYREEDGKVMKGPNYWKPEPLIKELLIETDEAREQAIGPGNVG